MLENNAIKVYTFEAGHNLCIGMKDIFKNDTCVIIEEFTVSDEQTILENVTWINAWLIGTPEQIRFTSISKVFVILKDIK